jgi:hypothetical protein
MHPGKPAGRTTWVRGILMILLTGCTSLAGATWPSGPGPNAKVPATFAWGLETDVTNKYLWRGITYNEGLVLQPNLFASYGNFSAGAWGNIVAFDKHQDVKQNELDLILTYAYSIGKLELDHTLTAYFYPGRPDDPPTCEFFLGAGYPIGAFTLVSSIAADLIAYPGSLYMEHGIEYSVDLTESLAIDAILDFSWGNRKYFDTYVGTKHLSSNMAGVGVQLTYKPGEPVYFQPHFRIYRCLNSDVASFLGKYPCAFGLLIGFEI